MTQSPTYLSTVPPCRNTISVSSVRYSPSTSATCSGSSRSAIDVKPRRSEKRTVTRRRELPRCASSLCRTISRSTAGEKKRESRRFSRCSWTNSTTTVVPYASTRASVGATAAAHACQRTKSPTARPQPASATPARTKNARSGRRRLVSQTAATAAASEAARAAARGAGRTGMPWKSVSRALAWISTPGMPLAGAKGVEKASWRIGVVEPTRTIFPLNASGETSPSSTR